MKTDIHSQGKSVSREEMLKHFNDSNREETNKGWNELSRRALSGLQYHSEESSLKDTLGRIDQRLAEASGMHRVFPLRQIASIAAGMALLLAAGYFAFFRQPSPEALFAQHFAYLPSAVQIENAERAITNGKAGPASAATLKAQAIQAYEAEDYQQAKPLMEQYLQSAPAEAQEVLFYYGIVLLGEGQAGDAAQALQKALDNLARPAYERPAKWYLALAYLKMGATSKAQPLLESLQHQNDRYATSARAILKKL